MLGSQWPPWHLPYTWTPKVKTPKRNSHMDRTARFFSSLAHCNLTTQVNTCISPLPHFISSMTNRNQSKWINKKLYSIP